MASIETHMTQMFRAEYFSILDLLPEILHGNADTVTMTRFGDRTDSLLHKLNQVRRPYC